MAKTRRTKRRARHPALTPPPESAPLETPPAAVGTGDAGPDLRVLRLSFAVAVVAVLILATVLHVHHLLTRPPNFDEHVHLQFLWLTAQGILPRDGFLCPYPPTAYYLFGPLLHLVPQEPWVFVLLRCVTLLPLAGLIGALCLAARHLGRRPVITAAFVLTMVASGCFPSLWEIRFDLLAWSLALLAFLLLLRTGRRLDVGTASGMAVLSLLLSPKHVCLVAGLALGFAISRLLTDRRGLPRDVLAALAGAATPVLAMLILRPAFIADMIDLSLMNYRTQLVSTYSITMLAGLAHMAIRAPFATAVLWAGPVLYLLQFRTLPRHATLLLGGLLAGGAATIAILPCGYDQYVSLAWAVFLPSAICMTPAVQHRGLSFAFAAGLLLLLARQCADEMPSWERNDVARHLHLQRELARLCPPGEIAASAPFTHPWFRRNAGYVFIDNAPSYRAQCRPERQAMFSRDHFYERLVAHPPALFCNFTTYDNQPYEYVEATVQFLERHMESYQLQLIPCDIHPSIPDGKLPVYIRKDLPGAARPKTAAPPS